MGSYWATPEQLERNRRHATVQTARRERGARIKDENKAAKIAAYRHSKRGGIVYWNAPAHKLPSARWLAEGALWGGIGDRVPGL